MARGVNKVILIGQLGTAPEIRYLDSGKAVVRLSIATNESWKDKTTGALQERTEWHRVVLFDKLAEISNQYLRSGAKVFIEGRLQTNKWQDQEGSDRYTTEIIGREMQMLDSRQGSEGMTAPRPTATPAPTTNAPTEMEPAFHDDDIPF